MKKSKEKTSKQKIPTYNLLRPTGNGAFGMVYQQGRRDWSDSSHKKSIPR